MLSVEEAYRCFSIHLRRFAPKTQESYTGVLRRFLDALPQNIAQITSEHVERFVLAKNYTASSRNVHLFAVRAFLGWVEMTYGITSVAKAVRQMKTLPPHQRILNKEEYTKLVGSTSGYTQDCIRFLANTGLRSSEFLSLTRENINGQFLTVIGKGGKRRAIPINKTVQTILNSNPRFQFSKSHNKVWLWRLCQRAAKLADIKPFYPHSLRHYFADQLHLNGVPIGVISKLMGHSSPLTTATIYIHWQDAELSGTTDCLV